MTESRRLPRQPVRRIPHETPQILTPEQKVALSPAEEAALFDRVFAIDVERDKADIETFMGRVRKDQSYRKIASQYEYKRDKSMGELKYSDEQIAAGQWEEADYDLVIEELRQERIDDYFNGIAHQYEQAHIIIDSIVRLDQEKAIGDDLDGVTPILIRGNWRLGKTSMVWSLIRRRYGEANAVYIDSMGESFNNKADMDEFRQHFGLYRVSDFIIDREFAGEDYTKKHPEAERIRKEIIASGKTPFEYLDEYLNQKGEKALVGIDEVIGYADQPEKLSYIASIKDLKNIKPAIVLHRIHHREERLGEIFEGYKTHFIRALTIDEVAALVRRPLEGTHVTFTDDAIAEIYAFSGGRPMEVHNMCNALMVSFAKHSRQKLVYRGEDVREIANKDLWQLENDFRVAIDTYGRVYNRSMGDDEKAIIDRLARTDGVPISEVDAGTIQPLIDTTYVRRDDQESMYRVNGELFRKTVLTMAA